ncbi:MAG: adenosylhomocysteinase [Candidatus Marinimicrobia bacterium]|jgi:adenosylhomocysteinase|nr:adenosylhomocysteinase [Candidatus Neomarinimicrobiota bacterium]MDX9777426.1 adenosylhomocysteinase [bacterium]
MNHDYTIKDLSLHHEGQQKIAWAAKWMKVLNLLADKYREEGVFKGKRITMCIHLEAKTAYLATVIKNLGADVWITSSNSMSTKDDVCAALVKNGIHVHAIHAADKESYRKYLHAVLACKPHVVIDDGGDLCELLHTHPEYAVNLQGICEETTTGVHRLKEKVKNGTLKYPALAINDAQSKYLFDNRYGTGQSTWTAITHLTNLTVAGRVVVVVGYGWVGRGVAVRAAGLGAEVVVTEINPWKAMEARLDGFRVMPADQAASLGDFFVTATGEDDVIRVEHIDKMKDGAFLSNAGHFGYEISVPQLYETAKKVKSVRENVEEITLKNGKKVYLLSKGDIINIAGGLGHPVEILDISFSLQLASIHHVLVSNFKTPGLYRVPEEIDEMVIREKMKIENMQIDEDIKGVLKR